MAESAVKSASDLLGKILIEEGKYLWGAEGKVKELREELLWMQSFLRQADTLQYQDETVQMWVSQIKEHVSEAEDIIDEFFIKVASPRRQNGFLNKFKRYSCILKEFYDLHKAASSIDSLKVKISTLTPKLEKYGLKRFLGINIDQAQETLTAQVQQSLRYAHIEDKKIIGLQRNVEEVINALKDTTPNRGFHAIYGMGGLGKTTLATKVFQDNMIKQHFSGGQAFVYISKQFQIQSVLEDVLKGLNCLNSGSSLSQDELVLKLHGVLKEKKCLVVLDDVWTEKAWNILKPAFTSCGRESGSKVLLTTRKEKVARYVDHMALQKPDPLNEDESWELFQKTMGCEPKETMGWEVAGTKTVGSDEDHEKMELGKKMMKVCNGLPLAIVVLGGILRKKQSLAGWQSVHNNICSYLRMGYDHGRTCMDIILQSYTDLPYHLKPCFLHLANFPEDYQIYTRYLYLMWVAEGLVKSSCDRTKSLEDVADDYLNDLAQAGLVEIVDRTSAGSIESVRLHDIVRDVCLETATTDNFLKVIDLRPGADQLQLNASVYYSSMRLLRLAVYLPEESVNSSIPDSVSSKAHEYVRSLLFITEEYRDGDEDEDRCQKMMANICNEFQMLRVLFVDNLNLGGKLTSKVGNLMHLRYLSLARAEVSELPSSIGNLSFLEILDLRVFRRVKIPNTLWKLFRLRHLYLPEEGYDMKRSKRLRVDTLIWLEIVENLQVKNLGTKDLLKIKNLRSLRIKDSVSTEEEILDIIAAHKSFGRRGSCFLRVEGDVISKKPNILSSFPCNLELDIDGQVMKDVEFPQYLVTLFLYDCQFEHDPMRMLGNLCHLRELSFYNKSYVGKKMSCHSYSFPVLIELSIDGLENLEVWELELGSMPMLTKLSIEDCINLNGFPDVLPSSLKSFRLDLDREGPVDLESVVVTVDPYGFTKWLYHEVSEGGYEKVVSWGKGDAGMATQATQLYHNRYANRHFDVVGRTCIPRRTLQRLLRDLNPRRIGHEELSKLSSDNLRAEIQQFMQQNKCLVILEEVDDDCLQDLDSTFGIIHGSQDFQSKLVITTTSAAAHADFHGLLRVFKLRPPTNFETWRRIRHYTDYRFVDTNPGIKWNMLRNCSDHPLSTDLLLRLLNMKENIADWATRHEELADSNSLQFSHIFALCYSDLPLHLVHCLIYLANFPVDVEIPTKKLYQMWIAAGFVGLNHNDDAQTEESIACSYLTELVQRGMITVLKEGPDERAKTCRLKLGLRDVCLEKAREEHILMIVDQFEHTTSASTPKFRTQQLALHLDQISPSTPVSLDEHLISLNFSCSPTSLLIFPNVSDPLYKEEKWEWFIYICGHFQSLWVLDLESMWMTKGSLPKEVGNLGQLRYLSLRGTWVSQLPPSIESLWSLQTLDLRVMESIIIPDVLWKLNCLEHLYLPDQFIAQETAKLRLHGLNFLQTVVNLHTDKVCLNDLLKLKLLRKISIRRIHAPDVVDELDNVLKHLSTSLDLCINSEIMNDDQTILSRFKNMRKLKIKGMLLVRLHPNMFPTQLEELTLKHTKLEEDPLPVSEKLLQLRSLVLDHESFLGKTMNLSDDFPECTTLTLCSLSTLETLYFPRRCKRQIVTIDCWRLKRSPR